MPSFKQGIKWTSHRGQASCPLSRQAVGNWTAERLALQGENVLPVTRVDTVPFPPCSFFCRCTRVHPHIYGFQKIPLSKIVLTPQLNLEQSQNVTKIHAGKKNRNWQQASDLLWSLHTTVRPSLLRWWQCTLRENHVLELRAAFTPMPWAS